MRIIVGVLTVLHWLLVLYALIGWFWPDGQGWRLVYALYIPAIMLQWRLNGGVCIINNLQNILISGKWRNPAENPEEGAFVLSNIQRLTGKQISYRVYNTVMHLLLAGLWVFNLFSLTAPGRG